MLIVGVVDAAFDEHASGANRLGIFRGQGTLLRAGWPRQRKGNKSKTHESKSAHERSLCGGPNKARPTIVFYARHVRPEADRSKCFSTVQQEWHRTIVDERDLHHRLKLAGRHPQTCAL